MKKRIQRGFLVFFFLMGTLCFSREVQVQEMRKIMDLFFECHVENKEMTPALLQRFLKVFITQFDAEKNYLLEGEVLPFLEGQPQQIELMLTHLKKGDFSDFLALNQLFCKAIERSRAWRELDSKQFSLEKTKELFPAKEVGYATTLQELQERQKKRLQRFFLIHQKHFSVQTDEQKKKILSLLEKKLIRFENLYLSHKENDFSIHVLKAFAKSLDAHSYFFSDEEAYEMRMSLEKQFEGIGIILSEGIEGTEVAGFVKKSPAEECGKIQIHDRLVEIDGKSIEDFTFEEVLEALKKKEQEKITLGLVREEENKQIFRVTLMRKSIGMDEERVSFSSEPFGDGIIGKIVLKSFYENSYGISSASDMKNAITALKASGNLKGIVLDLRENSGGFLSQAVKVAGLFMTTGVVVMSKYSHDEIRYLRNISPEPTYQGPLVVLTSKLSASAAEIVAQALQDYGLALVVGDERTFGKGSIQYQTVTNEKAEFFFKVTVGKYYTVSGRTTQIEGVKADILVPTEFFSIRFGERFLEYPLQSDRVEKAYEDSLSDLDFKTKESFQKTYVPYMQKYVSFWKSLVPILREHSAYRLAHLDKFQMFLKTHQDGKFRDWMDADLAEDDLQMEESVNIVKEMIFLEKSALIEKKIGA